MKYLQWNPNYTDNFILQDAYNDMQNYMAASADQIPFIVKLFENPKYNFIRFGRLKGSIDLFSHDILHILLKQKMSSKGEAYVIGFTMGCTKKTTWFDKRLFKFISMNFYPKNYRFSKTDFVYYEQGLQDGINSMAKDLHKIDYKPLLHLPIQVVKEQINLIDIGQ